MPRERIHHGNYGDRPEDVPSSNMDDSPTWIYSPHLDVGWITQSKSVQLAFNASAEWWEGWREMHKDDEDQTRFVLWSPHLSRDEINNLIRTLRRARNAVFGADE